MSKASGGTKKITANNAASSRAFKDNINKQSAQKKYSQKQMSYQNITEIDRSKFSTFVKTLPQNIKDMINVDISKAIVGTSKKLGGYINVNFNKLPNNEAMAVKSYLTKLGYDYQENGAVNTAISYKWHYKGK